MATAPTSYASALIESLRTAPSVGSASSVSLLPNPFVAPVAMPPRAMRPSGGGSLPSPPILSMPAYAQPQPSLPVSPIASPISVAPPPTFTPPFVPVMPIRPFEPQVPDYTDDLWGPDIEAELQPIPVPDYTEGLSDYAPGGGGFDGPDYFDDLYGPDQQVPEAPELDTPEPAQTFPVPDQPELEFVDIDPFVPDAPMPVTPIPMPELPDEPPLVNEIEVPDLMPAPVETQPESPAEVSVAQPAEEPSLPLPDEFVNLPASDVTIEDLGIVVEPPAEQPVSLPDEFVDLLEPEVLIDPLDIAIQPPTEPSISLPDEFIDVLEPEIPIEDFGMVIEAPVEASVALPDEFVNQLQPDNMLTDQDLLEMLLFEEISRELLTGPADRPVLPFPEYNPER